MKKVWNKVVKVARNPQLRPFEIWAIRAVVGLICVKLGIDAKSVLH